MAVGVLSIAGVIAGTHITAPSEGIKYYPYKDSGGTLTVCYGSTGKHIEMRTYSEQECLELYAKDLATAEKHVDNVIKAPLNVYQKAALIDFTFNVGGENLRTSTMAKRFNERNYIGGCQQLTRWVYVKSKNCHIPASNCKGIINRRQVELDWCLGKYEVDIDGSVVRAP